MTLGSLFDGSGGFPLAGKLCGITPLWASEVEPYPIAVTRARFPEMAHLGDVRALHGGEVPPVDVVTFGSPCQDLSVAGNRVGLAGERSGLFLEAARIIREMREATNGEYPKCAVWENVPGAFSSGGGEDFRTVLQTLIQIVQPGAAVPAVPKGGWPRYDCYRGEGWSLAYRVLDAQYWGVPQRRRRIYLVLHLEGGRAGAVLFERGGLLGHPASGGTAGKNTAGAAESGAGGAGRAGGAMTWDARGNGDGRTVSTITGDHEGMVTDYTSLVYWPKTANTLTARADGSPQPDRGTGTAVVVTSSGQVAAETTRCTVRRLTPTECARLQGFPDRWGYIPRRDSFTPEELAFWRGVRNTHAAISGRAVRDYTEGQMLGWYNKLHSDSAEYRMWGNGLALPTALYVMEGVAEELCREQNT